MADRFDEMAEQCVAKFSYMLPDSKAARDGAKAAIIESLRAVAEEPWNSDMDAAPKDEPILVGDATAAGDWWEAAYWYDEKPHEGWYMRGSHWTDATDGQLWPKFWRRVPAPPRKEG